MSPVNPDLLENALHTKALSGSNLVGVNVEGWQRSVSAETIREMFALSMGNVHWIGRTPETQREFFLDKNAIGKLDIALPLTQWSNSLLPHFLRAENIQTLFGIQEMEVGTVPNTNSLEAYKQTGATEDYQFTDRYSFVDTFYKARMKLSVGHAQKKLEFKKFIANFKNYPRLKEEFRQKNLGALFEAMYTFAALPEEAWEKIDSDPSEVKVGGYILRQENPGNYSVREFDSSWDERVNKNRVILVHIKRVNRQDVEAGRLSK